jgi:hypothetical protein
VPVVVEDCFTCPRAEGLADLQASKMTCVSRRAIIPREQCTSKARMPTRHIKANYHSTQTCKRAKDVRVSRLDRLDPVEEERCKRLRHGEARHRRGARPGNGHVPRRRLAISVDFSLELDGSARCHVRLTSTQPRQVSQKAMVKRVREDEQIRTRPEGWWRSSGPHRHVWPATKREAPRASLRAAVGIHDPIKIARAEIRQLSLLFSCYRHHAVPFASCSRPSPLHLPLVFSLSFFPRDRLVGGQGSVTLCTLGSRSLA